MIAIEDFSGRAENEILLRRIFADEELAMAKSFSGHEYLQFLAGRFCIKEATAKAVGTGFTDKVQPNDIVTLADCLGKPILHLRGAMQELVEEKRYYHGDISITHSNGIAIGFVVLVFAAFF